jgi:farnesyl-diphosphate farnesyltransferase
MDLRTESAESRRLDDLLVKTSRTFALSIPPLPEPTRREVTVAYLLFRIADTLEDATRWPAERQLEELAAFARLLERRRPAEAQALASRWIEDPPLDSPSYLELLSDTPCGVRALDGLSPTARELVCRHTVRTVERMASFVRRSGSERTVRLRDVEDLRGYCYAVAGIVGEMLTELFLLDRPNLEPIAPFLRANAARFGEALQLVNILKDAAVDVTEGREYLPAAVDRAEVLRLARGDLAGAGRYVESLQRGGAPRGLVEFTALPVLLAWRTLDRVERDGPGSKLTRAEVAEIGRDLERALARGESPLPG